MWRKLGVYIFSTISSFAKPARNSTFNFVKYQKVDALKLLSAANGVKMNLATILRSQFVNPEMSVPPIRYTDGNVVF